MKKKMKRIAALLLAAVMTMSVVGCGGKSGAAAEAGDRTVIYYAASYVTAQVRDI